MKHITRGSAKRSGCFVYTRLVPYLLATIGSEHGKSSESVQCAMLKACDPCADMGQL